MPPKRILLADNDPRYLETMSKFLRREGFKVLRARSPTEARRVLEQRVVDLVILDMRLVDDTDDKDRSGLQLAQEVSLSIPKIILTSFKSPEAVQEALAHEPGGLPAAVAFVEKQAGEESLLLAVRKWVGKKPFDALIDSTKDQLAQDFRDARSQSRLDHYVALGVAILGAVILLAGVALSYAKQLDIGVVSAVGGVLTQTISFLFFSRENKAQQRMARYHSELQETRWFQILLAACEEVPVAKAGECRIEVIRAAQRHWFSAVGSTGRNKEEKGERKEEKDPPGRQ